ncbi:MAG: hypothetical protein GX592_14275 [Clostridiales bacterium]|nr:hypothetical protein [Clostridiales bacterium]
MKRFIAFILVGCMLLFSAPALAQQVTDAELTLDFHFGARTGRYTGEVSGGLPDGSGTFVSVNEEEVEWTYTGEWSNGHFEGYGTTVWADGWREEGLYSNDNMNGEGAEYWGDTIYWRGIYVDDVFVQGQVFDKLGNPYFEGAFEDGFRIESPAEQAVRLAAFFGEAVDCDYDLIWDDYENYIGRKVVFAGRASYVWEDDDPTYQEFAIDVNNDPDEWIDAYGYMAKGEEEIAEGEENVMVFGVLLEKYRWEDDRGSHSAPLVQFVGVERLDFSCETLKVGSKGKAVKALQTRLQELGYLSGKIDGSFGKGTAQAVSNFQSASGLPADGVASLKTLYMLFATRNLPEQSGAVDASQPGVDVTGTYDFKGTKKLYGASLAMDPFTASVERSGSKMTISFSDKYATVITGTYDESTATFVGRDTRRPKNDDDATLWQMAETTIHFSAAGDAVAADGFLNTGELEIRTSIVVEFTLSKT